MLTWESDDDENEDVRIHRGERDLSNRSELDIYEANRERLCDFSTNGN